MPAGIVQRIEGWEPRARRSAEERAMARFPDLYRALMRVLTPAFRPGSRLRPWFVRRSVCSGWAAVSRSDLELMLVRYAPDVVSEWPQDFALGMPARMQGSRQYQDGFAQFFAAWAGWRAAPEFVVDLGDRVIVLAHVAAHGGASGIEIEFDLAQICDLHGGIVANERGFTDWAEGLRAAGIDPGVLPTIKSLSPGGSLELPPSAFETAAEPVA